MRKFRFLSLVLALALLALSAVPVLAAPVLRANNGTIKVHDGDSEDEPIVGNEPQVCDFHLHGFFFDGGQTGDWRIESWPPTGDGTVVASGSYTADGNGEFRTPASGYVYQLPDGHYKLYWQDNQMNKQKVFWVDCQEPTVTPTVTNTPTDTPTPGVTPTVTNTPTDTPTPGVTPTLPGDTPTPGVTPTVTNTPTDTPTPGVTPTLPGDTPTPGVTPTNVPTNVPTWTPTSPPPSRCVRYGPNAMYELTVVGQGLAEGDVVVLELSNGQHIDAALDSNLRFDTGLPAAEGYFVQVSRVYMQDGRQVIVTTDDGLGLPTSASPCTARTIFVSLLTPTEQAVQPTGAGGGDSGDFGTILAVVLGVLGLLGLAGAAHRLQVQS